MEKSQIIKIAVAAIVLIAAAVMIIKYMASSGGEDTGGRSGAGVSAIEAPLQFIA